MLSRKNRTEVLFLCLLAAVCLHVAAPPAAAQLDQPHPRAEVFLGYAWLHPGQDLQDSPYGFAMSGTYNFNSWGGLTADFGHHRGPAWRATTFMGGPRLSARTDDVTFFAHALFGLNRGKRHASQVVNNSFGAGFGGGIDLHAHRRLSVRLLEATYMYSRHPNQLQTETLTFHGARLAGGLVFNFGVEPPIPPSASCSAQPTQVMAGEPVQVTATGRDFRMRRPLVYTWNTTGGQIEGQGETVRVDTTGLSPGQYTVSARVTENRQEAQCNASFTVQEPPRNPPQVSCSANPRTVQSGDVSTVSCPCSSPDGNPVTLQWRTTGGRLTQQNQSATLDTAGLQAGPVTVTAVCSDDRNLTATGTATVNVEVPPPPPQASQVAEINFARNSARVDNEAKALLDDVALRLQRDADATAVVVGHFETNERQGQQLAAQRARNTKAYLTTERGIDPNRIQVRTGQAGTRTTVVYLVPAGATFDAAGTEVVPDRR
jgi:outer membrane protein OmpA-like peptidoglycan-associated protein